MILVAVVISSPRQLPGVVMGSVLFTAGSSAPRTVPGISEMVNISETDS